jgi:S1-C subfamily serine protease
LFNDSSETCKLLVRGFRTTRISIFIYFVFCCMLCSDISAAEGISLRKSVVKIFATTQNPNYYEPWRIDAQENRSGSGCILPGKRILTNAHVVSNQIFIQILKDGDTKKYTAKKEYVAHDCDLAILKVEDASFFAGTEPVSFGSMPFLKDKVSVYGYPAGGEVLSITEGVVSRIELIPYTHSMCLLLGVQTDAAINVGNSGGPVFMDRKLVGVAFQAYNPVVAQNTGYLIPIPLIKRFINSVSDGKYDPVPTLGVYAQIMENDVLRAHFGMRENQSGLLVSKVVYGSSAWGRIRENDVLLSIDGLPIANDGTIPFRKGERLNFQYPLCLYKCGETMPIHILRDGKSVSVMVQLKEDARLVPFKKYDTEPTYYIYAGLIFTPFNINYLNTLKGEDPKLLSLYFDGVPTEDRKQVVLISHILSHEINKGYSAAFNNDQVRAVNGHKISEMKDLIEAFKDPRDGHHVIEIDGPGETRIVLDADKSEQATSDVLTRNSIAHDRSQDLK